MKATIKGTVWQDEAAQELGRENGALWFAYELSHEVEMIPPVGTILRITHPIDTHEWTAVTVAFVTYDVRNVQIQIVAQPEYLSRFKDVSITKLAEVADWMESLGFIVDRQALDQWIALEGLEARICSEENPNRKREKRAGKSMINCLGCGRDTLSSSGYCSTCEGRSKLGRSRGRKQLPPRPSIDLADLD